MAYGAVADVGPAFEENVAGAIYLHGVEATLEADKVLPGFVALVGEAHQGFGALAGAAHQLVSRGGGVADTAFDVEAKHGELRCGC